MNYITLTYWDLVIAALLIGVNAALSIRLRLSLERQLLIAASRMVVQLGLLGLVLKVLFETVSLPFTAAAALVMILFAGYEVMGRQERRLAGWWSYGVGTGCMLFGGTIVTVFALTTQLQPEPWFHPRYALPLLGMILGNMMTGIALGLNTLATNVGRERSAIETMLALGYDRAEAFRPLIRESVRNGLIPIINSMSACGLVSIPGMMTGQILAGADPWDAIKYQLLVMFLIAGATGIGAGSAIYAMASRLTDARHRLRLDRLTVK